MKLGALLNTALLEFPCPNKIDRFVHNDRDRKTESIFTISVLVPWRVCASKIFENVGNPEIRENTKQQLAVPKVQYTQEQVEIVITPFSTIMGVNCFP